MMDVFTEPMRDRIHELNNKNILIAQLERELADLKARYECDCKEVTAARIYLRDQNRLLKELAECKEDAKDWKNRYEGMAILHANKVRMIENGDLVRRVNISKIEAECDALADQVVQLTSEIKLLRGNNNG